MQTLTAEAERLEAEALASHRSGEVETRNAYLDRAASIWTKAGRLERAGWCEQFKSLTAH